MGTHVVRARELVSPVDRTLSMQLELSDGRSAPARVRLGADYSDFLAEKLSPLRVLYLPSQIGCMGTCAFCDFRDWFARSLSAAEVVAIAHAAIAEVNTRYRDGPVLELANTRGIVSEMGDALYVPDMVHAVDTLASALHSIEICTSCPAGPGATSAWDAPYLPWLDLAARKSNVTIRASVHHSNNDTRLRKMAPGESSPMLSLGQIALLAREHRDRSGRRLSLNYMAVQGSIGDKNVAELLEQFPCDTSGIVVSPYYPKRPLGGREIAAALGLVTDFSGRLRRAGYTVTLDLSAGWTLGEGNGRHTGVPLNIVAPPPQ